MSQEPDLPWEGWVDHHWSRMFIKVPIEEVAHRLALLQQNRPEKYFHGDPNKTTMNPFYLDHMNAEYQLEEEIFGRVGKEYAEKYKEKARKILNLLT